MTKKTLRVFLIILGFIFLMPIKGYAQSNNPFEEEIAQAQPSQKDPNELFKTIQKANASVHSITQIINTNIVSQTEKNQFLSQQMATMDLLFNSKLDIIGGHLYSEYAKGNTLSYKEKYLAVNEKTIWSRQSENDEWIKETAKNYQHPVYFANPSYHSLIEKLASHADHFKLYEEDDAYILINKNHSHDILESLQKEFHLSVSGIQIQDLESNIMITFDKETLFFKDLVLISRYQKANNYLEINIITEISQWNKLNKENYVIHSREDI